MHEDVPFVYQNPLISSFMTCQRLFDKSNATGVSLMKQELHTFLEQLGLPQVFLPFVFLNL